MTWRVKFEQVGAIAVGYVLKHDDGRYYSAPDGSLETWFNRWGAQAVANTLNGEAAPKAAESDE